MSGNLRGIKITPLPEDKEVENVLTFREKNSELVSTTLVGALMVVQNGGMELEVRQQFVEEYNKVLTLVLAQNSEQQDKKRSYKAFTGLVIDTFRNFPESEVLEFFVNELAYTRHTEEVSNNRVSFYLNSDLQSRFGELFIGKIPEYIIEELYTIGDDAYSISVSCLFTCVPESDETFGVECVFEIVYSDNEATNQELDITYTFDNQQEAYDLLLRLGKQGVPVSEILTHNNTDFSEEDVWFVLKDIDIRNEIQRVDLSLYMLLESFVDEAHKADRSLILSSLNKRLDRKSLLEIYSSEWSIGRLSYLLNEHKNEEFNLRVFEEDEPGPNKIVSMRHFPAYNQECEVFFHEIKNIFRIHLQHHRGQKDIRCEFFGKVNDDASVYITMYVTAKGNKHHAYKATLGAPQLIDLITLLVGEGVTYMNDAFDRREDEDDEDHRYRNDDYEDA